MPKVTGLIDLQGASGFAEGDDWGLLFNFVAYKIGKGDILHEELTVTMKVSEKKLDKCLKKIDALSVIKVKGKLRGERGNKSLEVTKLIERRLADEPFEAIARELRKPVIFKSKVFGMLRFDRRVDCFDGVVKWRGCKVRLSLFVEDQFPIREAEKFAKKVWKDQDFWDKRILAFATKKLLKLKNESWLDEGEKPLKKKKFLKKLVLCSISLYRGGAFEFNYDAGDLFYGHQVTVSCDLKKGPTDASI